MSVDHVASQAVQTPVQSNPLYPAAKADPQAVTGLVVQIYKVEAESRAVLHAVALFEQYTGKLKAAEVRLATYANLKNPTADGLKKMEADVAELTSFLNSVEKGIYAAMDGISAATPETSGRLTAVGLGGVAVRRSGQSWSIEGTQLKFDVESKLPVKPNAGSIQLHKSLIDQYKDEISAAEKALNGPPKTSGSKPLDAGLVKQYVDWLKAEVDKTQASLQQAEGKMRAWANLGLTADPESKLPVQPNLDSMRSHQALMARYQQEMSAADQVLGTVNNGVIMAITRKEIWDHKDWLNAEMDRTHASLREAQAVLGKEMVKSRDQETQLLDQRKASYDTLCLELSTIKDNGVDRNPARVAVLDRDISQLEVSMKEIKASLELANSIINGTYIPAR